ncbi:TPA: hypothetical protein ACH3X1_004742 [Trebouxia sp. C0004]
MGRTSLTAASPCGATSLRPHHAAFRRLTRVKVRKSRARPGFPCKTSLCESLAFVPGICFDRQCQEAADRVFLTVTLVPLLGLLVAIILRFRPAAADNDQVFDDPATGVYFESPDGTVPERDRKGELAFRPVSFTPWPVEAGTPGERLRIDVGPASETSPRTFIFDRRIVDSDILKVTLPRPMGLVFEEDKAKGQVVVADFVEGSEAEKRNKVAKLNQSWRSVAQVGDVLRACTCTNLVYATRSLLGVKAPVRTIVVYGADNQKWPKVLAALKAGFRSDGEVTLIFERQRS